MRTKRISSPESEIDSRPTLTPEARENRIIADAYDLAEKQIREGTASSQVLTHFLKLGSSKEKQEREKQAEEIKLLRARTESLEALKSTEELYRNAIKAMQRYSGALSEEDPEDENY